MKSYTNYRENDYTDSKNDYTDHKQSPVAQFTQRMFMSLMIEVDLSPVFRSASSLSHLSLELAEEEATVKGLLHRLAGKCGQKMKFLLFEKGEEAVLSGLMVMVNDQTFTGTALNQQDVPLHDMDKVSLLYFVSGG